MDRSEVKAIVDREIWSLLRKLGIPHWTVDIAYDLHDDDQLGECTRLLDYDKARIRLNPDQFEDEASVLITLRHELYHVVLAPFDLFSTAVDRLALPAPTREVLERVWDHACERAVLNLERMFCGLCDD